MKYRSVTASVLAAVLLLSLSGCSQPDTPPVQTPVSTQQTDSTAYKVFTGTFAARLNELDPDNDVQKLIAEKTGVILKETFIADQDDINKTFSDMMISNKYPDFMSPDATNCQLLIKFTMFLGMLYSICLRAL